MAEPFAYAEFQGEPDLPHYLMAAYDVRSDLHKREVNLFFLIDGPVRMVGGANLSVGHARVLDAQIQQHVNALDEEYE